MKANVNVAVSPVDSSFVADGLTPINTAPSGSVLASEGLPYEIPSFQLEGKIPIPFSLEDIRNIGDLTLKAKPGAKPEERKNEIPLGYRIYTFSK